MKQLPLGNYSWKEGGTRKTSDLEGAQGYNHRDGDKVDRNQEFGKQFLN